MSVCSLYGLEKKNIALRGRSQAATEATFVPFTAQTRMSGVNLDGREIRKGANDAIVRYLGKNGSSIPAELQATIRDIASSGGTPLIVAENRQALGVIHLKDIVKGGIRDRFSQLRDMAIPPLMITPATPLTAAAISRQ